MSENAQKPRIRFKGFSDAWEQRKLWQLTIWDKKFNGVESYKQVKVIKYPYVLADVFSQIEDTSGTVRLLSTGSYIGYTTKEKAGNNLCYGEIVAIPWGGVANIKYYNGFFVTADNRIATSSNTQVLSNRYLHWWMESNITQIQSTYRGASIQHPSMNDILSLSIYLPSIEEQEKISNKLDTLDNLITLHQRKYDKLVAVKKALLEKMFPADGETVPKIRFKGFSDAWEQRKLGELSSLITKGTTPLDKNNSGIVNFVKIESIDESSGDITITQRISIDEHNGYLRRSQLKENDILFSIAGTLGRVTSVKSSILPANTNQALAIIRLKDGCLDYVKTYLKGKAVAEFIKKNPTIGAQPNLSLEQVANLEIAIPSVSEQVKIGNYFEKLDNLITLHQRQLEKLKNIKTALLEKMFV